ncbi:MAG: TIGR00730 family Rossman fold protein [Pyramidobacter sp.]|nr:TIGR00730 family Rossman fold protein [Pyramidobacter sp.]
MKICVFCSSSDRIDESFLRAGRQFGIGLGRRGHELIYGGYGRGLMGEVARGAYEAGAKITAVVPAIFDDDRFIYQGCARVIRTPDLRTRKAVMQAEAGAFAVLPGGVGTYDEFFDTLALISLGQLDTPVVALDVGGFFSPLRKLLEDGVARGFIGEGLTERVVFYASVDELLDGVEHVMAGKMR